MNNYIVLLKRADGAQIGLTDAPEGIYFNGVSCPPVLLPPQQPCIRGSDGQIGSAQLQALVHAQGITAADLYANRWAGALVQIYVANPTPVLHWSGTVGSITFDAQHFTLNLQGLAQQLQSNILRSYLKTCDAAFGDARCGINATLPAYTAQGVITAVVHRTAFVVGSLAGNTQPWQGGSLALLNGLNAGLTVGVKDFISSTGTLWLATPLPFAVTAGDGVRVTVGCDKTIATCVERFGNGVNFRGCPFMVGLEKLLLTPTAGDNNDGGVW